MGYQHNVQHTGVSCPAGHGSGSKAHRRALHMCQRARPSGLQDVHAGWQPIRGMTGRWVRSWPAWLYIIWRWGLPALHESNAPMALCCQSRTVASSSLRAKAAEVPSSDLLPLLDTYALALSLLDGRTHWGMHELL